MPVILLVRHGEHPLLPKRLAGRMPGVHLSEAGRKQAEALAERLANFSLKAVYSSPMERATETAAPLAARLGLPVQIVEGVSEVDYGHWVGRTYKQLGRYKLWKLVQTRPSLVRFPGGESLVEAQARAVQAVEALAASLEEKDWVPLFTHGDMVRLLVAHYLQIPLDVYTRLLIDTASITALAFGKEGRVYVPHINQVMDAELYKPPVEPLQKKAKARGE